MGRPSTLSPATIKEIKQSLWEGVSQETIALSVGISIPTVNRIKRGLAGAAILWPDGGNGPMSEERILELIQLRRRPSVGPITHKRTPIDGVTGAERLALKEDLWNGHPQMYVADRYGLSQSTVSKIYRGFIAETVPWPDGSLGGIPGFRMAELSIQRNNLRRKNVSAVRAEIREYDMTRNLNAINKIYGDSGAEWEKSKGEWQQPEAAEEPPVPKKKSLTLDEIQARETAALDATMEQEHGFNSAHGITPITVADLDEIPPTKPKRGGKNAKGKA